MLATSRSFSDISNLVIDANVAVWTVLPILAQFDVLDRMRFWQAEPVQLCAPTLWTAEAISAIRRAVYARIVTQERGLQAIDDLFTLEVDLLPMEPHRCQSALQWAARLNQARAYDAFYMALAEELDVEFWTADRRLARAAQQAGVTWTHYIGDTVEGS
jgi:predicted nucleic acid-binding protein